MIKNLDDFNELSARLLKDFPFAPKLTLPRDVINHPELCAKELQSFLNRFSHLMIFYFCEKPLADIGPQPAIHWTRRQQRYSEELSRHHSLCPLHAA